jgi:Ca2+-binding RTX toxin-like protein
MLLGTSVKLQIFAPTLDNPISAPASATISNNLVEFDDASFFDLNGDPFNVVACSFDIIGAEINYSLLQGGAFSNVSDSGFNGYALTFDALTQPSGRVSINAADLLDSESSLQITQDDISFDRDTVFMNVDGLPFSTGDTVNIILGFKIDGSARSESLQGDAGRDRISGLSGNDKIAGLGGKDILFGGQGNDQIDGGSGSDKIYGGTGTDTIKGGTGDDTIDSGAGNDILFGNSGADNFVFNDALSATTNVDAIKDFVVNVDDIFLSRADFAAIGTSLTASEFKVGLTVDSTDHIIYNKATGELFYDTNGSGAGGRTLFATVTAGTALTLADFVMIA